MKKTLVNMAAHDPAAVAQMQSTLFLLETQLVQAARSGVVESVSTLTTMIYQQTMAMAGLGVAPMPYGVNPAVPQASAPPPPPPANTGPSDRASEAGGGERRGRTPPRYDSRYENGDRYDRRRSRSPPRYERRKRSRSPVRRPRSARSPDNSEMSMSPKDAEAFLRDQGVSAGWNYMHKSIIGPNFRSLPKKDQDLIDKVGRAVRHYLRRHPEQDHKNAAVARQAGEMGWYSLRKGKIE